jgi:hypothetical protein
MISCFKVAMPSLSSLKRRFSVLLIPCLLSKGSTCPTRETLVRGI